MTPSRHMGRDGPNRIVIGFHRLGLLLAIPVFIGALAMTVWTWFQEDGPYVPDTSKTPTLAVTVQPKGKTDLKQFTDNDLMLASATFTLPGAKPRQLRIESGPIRTFLVYRLKDSDPPLTATIARYRRTGRSKDEPLNVTSCGDSTEMRSTNDAISAFSDRSPTCGAPRASTTQRLSSRWATRAPMQMMEW